jgi:hypothetical protein
VPPDISRKSIPALTMRPICSITSEMESLEDASTLLSLIPMQKSLLVASLIPRMILRTISALLDGDPPNSSVLRLVLGDRNWASRYPCLGGEVSYGFEIS